MTKACVALKLYLSYIGLEGDIDILREGIKLLTQMLIELEAKSRFEQKSMSARQSERFIATAIVQRVGYPGWRD